MDVCLYYMYACTSTAREKQVMECELRGKREEIFAVFSEEESNAADVGLR